MSKACSSRRCALPARVGAFATLVFVTSLATSATYADPAGPLIITGADITNSTGPWLPDIPSSAWIPLSISVPPNNTYVTSGNPVDDASVSVLEGSSLSVTFPKNRVPDVVFELSGAEVLMNDFLTIEWPNVHNYPVGESHLVFAYEPVTDRWTVCGAATVNAQGTALVQVDNSFNTTLSYYFVDENVLLQWPGS
ncbi:MAG: hypothetical protein AB8G17_01870 [Gammaproteobacteria bacterium]